jgi:Na+/H+ antiporter NhaD/arsenite permease-like protein
MSLRAWDHPILATIRGVESLILKLVVTPALIGAASLAGRRWGSVPLISASLATLIALVVVLFLVPRTPDKSDKSESPATLPRWDIPARMVVATVFVVLLTGVAPVLGPYLSGLLSPFPLFGAILVVFVHRSERATSAMKLLRGLLFGLFAPAGFFMALSALIEPLGIGLGFAATATALVAQGITLRVLRPETLSG